MQSRSTTLKRAVQALEDHLLTMHKIMHCESVQDMYDLVHGDLLLKAA